MKLQLVILVFCFLSVTRVTANVVGADTQNFNPITNGLDFVTVHSSETLQPGILNLGLFINYAANTLPSYEDPTRSNRNYSDSLLSMDLNFGMGILNNWDFGMSFPQLLNQSVEGNAVRGGFDRTGLTEIRANTKFRFWGDPNQGLAVVASANFDRIENNPYVGTGAGPTLNLELAADTTFDGRIAVGGNLGYRFRQPGRAITTTPIEPLDDQFIASVAASYLVKEWDTKFIGEIFGSYPAVAPKTVSRLDMSSGELLFGVKHDLRHNVALHAGFGTELSQGTSSPDWRVYTGINVTFGPLWAEEKNMSRVEPGPKRIEVREAFLGTPQDEETFVARDVLFEFDSSDVSPRFGETLKKMVEYLNRAPGFKMLTIEGHTDSVGAAEYNLNLSRRRADSVRQYLISQVGVPASKVKAIGYGESRPITDNGNFQGRAQNRRVEFVVQRR